MNDAFLARLNHARELAGVPFHITSGFRCGSHNREVGGRENSRHMTGEAVDILCIHPRERGIILEALNLAGIVSVAIHESFIHCDTMDERWCGLY